MSVSDLEQNFLELLGAYLVLNSYKNEVSYLDANFGEDLWPHKAYSLTPINYEY